MHYSVLNILKLYHEFKSHCNVKLEFDVSSPYGRHALQLGSDRYSFTLPGAAPPMVRIWWWSKWQSPIVI